MKKKSKKMRYEYAPDIQEIAEEISHLLFPHVKMSRVKCFRSFGSNSRYTIARCHTIGKLMQETIGVKAFYGLEFISERFDKLSEEEKIKTIIHELMHIPKSFGGGFRHHDHVCDKNVNMNFVAYKKKKNQTEESDFLGLEKLKRKLNFNSSVLKDFKE
jgi:predicted metallopeptidase